MLNVKTFVCNMLQENCYVVSDETRECVIIDCGALTADERGEVVGYIREAGLKPRHLLATHGHLDHNFGNPAMFKEFGLLLEIHREDESLINHYEKQAEIFYQLTLDEPMPEIGKLLTGDDVIDFGSHRLAVIETPGHSRGGVFYYCAEENVCFSGDTLFRHSVGRADLRGGSMFMLIESLRRVAQLPDETVVYPGHGQQTTIGEEVAENPFIDR